MGSSVGRRGDEVEMRNYEGVRAYAMRDKAELSLRLIGRRCGDPASHLT